MAIELSSNIKPLQYFYFPIWSMALSFFLESLPLFSVRLKQVVQLVLESDLASAEAGRYRKYPKLPFIADHCRIGSFHSQHYQAGRAFRPGPQYAASVPPPSGAGRIDRRRKNKLSILACGILRHAALLITQVALAILILRALPGTKITAP